MEEIKLKGCRHTLGSICGICVTCRKPVKVEYKKFNGKERRMERIDEGKQELELLVQTT